MHSHTCTGTIHANPVADYSMRPALNHNCPIANLDDNCKIVYPCHGLCECTEHFEQPHDDSVDLYCTVNRFIDRNNNNNKKKKLILNKFKNYTKTILYIYELPELKPSANFNVNEKCTVLKPNIYYFE